VVRAAISPDGVKDTVLDEIAWPRRQYVLGQAQILLEFTKAPQAVECIPDDEHRPSVADRVQRPCDRALRPPVTGSFNDAGLASCS
jgi:hypothetical protein